MPNILTNPADIIISATATPTAQEIAEAFSPKTLKPLIDSLATADSGRSDDGVMHIYWVLDRVRKLEITLPPGTISTVSSILNKVVGKSFWLTFTDPYTGTELTRKMYCSNASSDWYSGVMYNGLLQDVSFNCIELGGELGGTVING